MSVFKRDGADTYSYDFQFRGRRFSGNTGAKTKREAERHQENLRNELKASNVDPAKPLNFKQAASKYWLEIGQHHANADTTLRNLAWLEAEIGAKTMLADVDDNTVARIVAKRRIQTAKGSKTRVSAATVNRTVLEPLSGILRRAAKTWKAKVGDIDWPEHFLPEPEERVRETTAAEEGKLLNAMRDDYAPAVQFAILTGCRRAEIVGLAWEDVNFFARDFRVTGKGDRSRTIPMSQAVFDLLWTLRPPGETTLTGSVFTYQAIKTRDGRIRGQRYAITLEGFKTAWRRGRKDAGVIDFRFHDTRHTAATRLVRATGNLRLAQRLLGHTDVATTTKYAHVTHDDLRAGVEAVANSSKIKTQLIDNARVKRIGEDE